MHSNQSSLLYLTKKRFSADNCCLFARQTVCLTSQTAIYTYKQRQTSLGFLRSKLQLLVFVLVHHKVKLYRILYGTGIEQISSTHCDSIGGPSDQNSKTEILSQNSFDKIKITPYLQVICAICLSLYPFKSSNNDVST